MYHHSVQINPIYKKGSKDQACLLIHGFTGTPDCLRDLANELHSRDYTVHVPLLAGHGTTKEDLAKTSWKDWYKTVEDHLRELEANYSKVYVAGLSMGGLLSLKLALDFPNTVKAFSCLATPLFLKRWVHLALPLVTHSPLKYIYRYQNKATPDVKDPVARQNYWSTDAMPISCVQSIMDLQKLIKPKLKKIHQPAMLIHARYDSTAPYESMGEIARHLSSKITETVTLENSYHIITIDFEKDLVTKKVCDFFDQF